MEKFNVNELNKRLQEVVGKSATDADAYYLITTSIRSYFNEAYGEGCLITISEETKSHQFTVYSQGRNYLLTVKYAKQKGARTNYWYGPTYNWTISRVEVIEAVPNVDAIIDATIKQIESEKIARDNFKQLCIKVGKLIQKEFNFDKKTFNKVCSELENNTASWYNDDFINMLNS